MLCVCVEDVMDVVFSAHISWLHSYLCVWM